MTHPHDLIQRLMAHLPPGPWYVEELRPGHRDEARIYDKRQRGVCKLTTGLGPEGLREQAEAFARIPELFAALDTQARALAEQQARADRAEERARDLRDTLQYTFVDDCDPDDLNAATDFELTMIVARQYDELTAALASLRAETPQVTQDR